MNKKDLGVIITDKLDVTEQCVKASNKANAMLGMIIKYKIKEVRCSCKTIQVPSKVPSGLWHSGMVPIQTKRYKLIRKCAM